MKYKKVENPRKFTEYVYHVTHISNLESIKTHGLIRPDILKKRKNIKSFSPYEYFESTRKKHFDTYEKSNYTYFGEWCNNTFQEWKNDKTVIDNAVILKLKNLDPLIDKYKCNGTERYRSKDKEIPFDKFVPIGFVSSVEKMEKLNFPYCLLKIKGELELYSLEPSFDNDVLK